MSKSCPHIPPLPALAALLLLAFTVSLLVGTTGIGWPDAFVLTHLRLPASLTAMTAGAALAGGGLVMQTLFRNPLADPSLLGVTSGAGLGAAIALLAFGSFALSAGFALAGALAVIALITAASARLHGSAALLVAGVMLACLIGAATNLLSFFATAEGVRSYVIWGLGDFGGVTGPRLAAYIALTLPVLALAPLASKGLDALLLGTDYAQSVGIAPRRWRTALLIAVGWLTALTTAVCGPIAFIGLAVPHAARIVCPTALHRRLLPATLLLGAATALACLIITRLPAALGIITPILPLGAITPLIGAPVILHILTRSSIRT